MNSSSQCQTSTISCPGITGKQKNANQNIQVYVRVRPLNSREKLMKSTELVQISGLNEVTVKHQSGSKMRPLNSREKVMRCTELVETQSSKEIVVRHQFDAKMQKKFTFDRAFGKDSRQSEVYHTVVAPLIEEVLAGYNCTVFAYGQTGTGKTHTMIGTELPELKSSWEDESLVGIIPRALSHLFDELRLMEMEFTMRISYLELYNEELCDLLSTDDSVKIRIFDDTTKKGSVIIQGLEEIIVHSKDDVYKLLEKGKERRKTATTLLNAQSSRSHTVFTITVHIKENNIDGEEMLKIGKLNLVDLAGSENISKAGNEKGIRTRETVNINQSLLTLGRVITALVERTPHIPYRESKLTRLLQESLGGRTKTSIIATISPGNKDIEETLSTLDYAHRAKNIQNRPEINQKLTKKTVLKEYTEEIDRLKRDLLAARDKNGIYLAEETYNDMTDKLDSQNKELNEKILLIKALKDELANKEQIFNEISLNLVEKSQQLVQTETNLFSTKTKLEQTKQVLNKTKRRYKEKKTILTDHMKTEEELTNQATKLIEVADIATKDHVQLHETLERRKHVEEKIVNSFEQFVQKMHNNFGIFKYSVDELNSDYKKIVTEIKKEIELYNSNHKISSNEITTKLFDISKYNEENLNEFNNLISKYETEVSDSEEINRDMFKSFISDIKLREQDKMKSTNDQLIKLFEILNEIKKFQTLNSNKLLENTLKIDSQVKDFSISAQNQLNNISLDFSKAIKQNILSINDFSNKQSTTRNNIRSQIDDIDSIIKNLRKNIDEDELESNNLHQVCAKINENSENLINKLSNEMKYVIQFEENYANDFNNSQLIINQADKKISDDITICCNQIEEIKDFNDANAKNSLETIQKMETETLKSTNKLISDMNNQLKDVIAKIPQQTMKNIQIDSEELIQKINDESKTVRIFKVQTDSLVTSTQNKVENYRQKCTSMLEETEDDLDSFHKSELKTYTPTGETPSKKNFVYPRALAQTSPHENIIRRFRIENEWSDVDSSNNTISEEGESTIEENYLPLNSTPIKQNNTIPMILTSKVNLSDKIKANNTIESAPIIKATSTPHPLSIFKQENKENFC